MTDIIEVTLKPCPFCGNDGGGQIENSLHVSMCEHDWRDTSWSVQCDKCTATMGYSDSEDEAITAWNTRTDNALDPATVEHCAKIAEEIAPSEWAKLALANPGWPPSTHQRAAIAAAIRASTGDKS